MKTRYIIIATFLIVGGFMFNIFKPVAGDKNTGDISTHLKELDESKASQIKWKEKDDKYWKSVLSSIQYKVTRKAGTERPFTGRYWDNKEQGVYTCSNCGLPLFSSQTKFKSGTGWPSFYDIVQKSNVKVKEDTSFGMKRVEALCSRCDAHLGHIFEDGPKPTGLRYCINSVSLNFKKENK